MAHFANAYWSPDYISGIDSLARQSQTSLGQLHELRAHVFAHMKFFHANGDYLAGLLDSSAAVDSCFRTQRTQRQVSSTRKFSRGGAASSTDASHDMNALFRQFVMKAAADSLQQQRVAADIDAGVLRGITAFIKAHEPRVQAAIARLHELYRDYAEGYTALEDGRAEYDTIARVCEFHLGESAEVPAVATPPAVAELPESTEAEPDHGVSLGGLAFETRSQYVRFLETLMAQISTTRRMIPLPGYKNDIFSSEQLCDALRQNKPRGFNPTRSNLEKAGQALLEAKVLVVTGFFSKKFASEGMWFEWADGPASPALKKLPPPPALDEKWSTVASSTSKTFNEVLNSVKSSLLKTNYTANDLALAEEHYNELYDEFHRAKHLLEVAISEAAISLHTFEKAKIELVYHSLTKLLQVLSEASEQKSAADRELTQRIATVYDQPANHEAELRKMVESFGCGIYFPADLAPSAPRQASKHTNTHFQNIRLGFNLFKDIPLQLQNADANHTAPLHLHSVPFFLGKVLDSFAQEPHMEIQAAWEKPLDQLDFWLVKLEVVELLQNVSSKGNPLLETEAAILSDIASHVGGKTAGRRINFLKGWLLETTDSVIPSTVYDSLISNYSKMKAGKSPEEQAHDAQRILSAIPRSNLSSLLSFTEHVCTVFELDLLPEYHDSVSEPQQTPETLSQLAAKLNLMNCIPAIPLVHLIMRPSVVKHSGGLSPPIHAYNALLGDLLALPTRASLLKSLLVSENNFIDRQEQKRSLGLQRRHVSGERHSSPKKTSPELLAPVQLQLPKSPRPLKSAEFELRPFRTGSTPRPSPTASPVNPKRRIDDSA